MGYIEVDLGVDQGSAKIRSGSLQMPSRQSKKLMLASLWYPLSVSTEKAWQ